MQRHLKVGDMVIDVKEYRITGSIDPSHNKERASWFIHYLKHDQTRIWRPGTQPWLIGEVEFFVVVRIPYTFANGDTPPRFVRKDDAPGPDDVVPLDDEIDCQTVIMAYVKNFPVVKVPVGLADDGLYLTRLANANVRKSNFGARRGFISADEIIDLAGITKGFDGEYVVFRDGCLRKHN
ncbi:hypothetical protein BJ508DRAFT_333742 [Ascobolus immersus RN42]|uniref:Uncharacterized protein n=1 Tax=Ascobolus immersus RN42 TaxID=1160509 RepID=A0A3N4HKH6_ASCIM|nr:hypothetical protein BJ508DRAFT_333742 [Ascobolus immersus RN42]